MPKLAYLRSSRDHRQFAPKRYTFACRIPPQCFAEGYQGLLHAMLFSSAKSCDMICMDGVSGHTINCGKHHANGGMRRRESKQVHLFASCWGCGRYLSPSLPCEPSGGPKRTTYRILRVRFLLAAATFFPRGANTGS